MVMPERGELLLEGPHLPPATVRTSTSICPSPRLSLSCTQLCFIDLLPPLIENAQVLHSADCGRQLSSRGGGRGLQLQTQPHQDNTTQGS